MRTHFLHHLLMVAAFAAVALQVGCTGPAHRDGVFVHIRSGPDHPHAVLMGLHMARMMSDEKDVLVYVDVAGIGVVVADAVPCGHIVSEARERAILTMLSWILLHDYLSAFQPKVAVVSPTHGPGVSLKA